MRRSRNHQDALEIIKTQFPFPSTEFYDITYARLIILLHNVYVRTYVTYSTYILVIRY